MVVVDMTYMDLKGEMEALGFPCAYGSFKSAPPIPFTVIQFAYSDDMMADNHNYKDIGNYQLEYYNSIKFPPDEILIQNKLKELKITYTKTEDYIESENLYQIVYDIQLI